MTESFRTNRRVEFADTDAAGIAHFTAFMRWMEQAEHEFLRSRGLSVMSSDETGPISWPRVFASCDFRGAVRFEDTVDIDVAIDRLGEKSITYAFTFSHGGATVAEGTLTAVCCRLTPGKPPQSIGIPEWFREKLGESGKRKAESG